MLVTNFHEISLIGRKIDRTLMTPVASVQRHKGGGGGVYGDLGRNPRRPRWFVIESGGREKNSSYQNPRSFSKNSSSSLFKIGGRGRETARGREKSRSRSTVQKKRYSTNRMAVRLNAKLFSAGETKEGGRGGGESEEFKETTTFRGTLVWREICSQWVGSRAGYIAWFAQPLLIPVLEE